MLIFACQRKLLLQNRLLHDSAARGKWVFDPIYPVYRLSGKTLGIIGFGRIGAAVYRMMQGFEMRFLVCDPYLSDARKKEFGIETLPLDHVLKESDIVTVHTPLNSGNPPPHRRTATQADEEERHPREHGAGRDREPAGP